MTIDPALSPYDLIAARLIEARRVGETFSPVRIDGKPIDMEGAYEIQARYLPHRQASGAGDVVGYKVGLTSQAMQTFCGVHEPIVGRILSGGVHANSAKLDPAAFTRLGLESEMALRLGRSAPVVAEGQDVRILIDCIASVHAAFEVIEDRNADYKVLDAPSIAAENSWNAGIVVGAGVAPGQIDDLAKVGGRLLINGDVRGSGVSADVLGSPLNVLAWLTRFLDRRGEALQPGQWIMTGSIIPTIFPAPGDRFEFVLDGLPSVQTEMLNAPRP